MKKYAILATLFGMTAVMLGAFGAHGLRKFVDDHGLEIWNKGVQYQFYHTFALFIAFFLFEKYALPAFKTTSLLFSTGIFLFSGSLYILACKDILPISESLLKIIGPITPLGGLSFITGWCFLLFGVLKTAK